MVEAVPEVGAEVEPVLEQEFAAPEVDSARVVAASAGRELSLVFELGFGGP